MTQWTEENPQVKGAYIEEELKQSPTTVEEKMRAALEHAKECMIDDLNPIPILKQIDEALAMKPSEPDDLKKDLLAELDDLKTFIFRQTGGHIKQQLLDLPEQIRLKSLDNAALTAEIENVKLGVANLKNQMRELVLCATENGKPKYSNDQARNLAIDLALKADQHYLAEMDILNLKECELRKEQVELEYLHNQFRAYLVLAGMQGVR